MGQDPDQIRREIEETRAQMGDTVDAIAQESAQRHGEELRQSAQESVQQAGSSPSGV